MIEVRLGDACGRKLKAELARAGSNEIGGVLAAENLGGGAFEIVDLSVQRSGGGFASFVRKFGQHDRFMRRFFDRTGHRYERFNYFGEWHSHPSFPALPSVVDGKQMQLLLREPDQKVNFLVLLVVKAEKCGIEASAHAFARGMRPMRVPLSGDVLARERGKAGGRRAVVQERLALARESIKLVR